MRRTTLAMVTTIIATTTLAGCGGSNPYCDAVTKDKSALDTFGATRTTAGFTSYAKVATSLSKTAPATVTKDWKEIADATAGVLTAHKKAGISLQDMTDTTKVAALGSEDLKRLNDAYDAFNDTTSEREAVVANIKSECDITLKSS